MNSFNHEFIDLTKFDYDRFNGDIVVEKDTQIKYGLTESNNFLYDFSRNKIISFSQEINILSQVSHPSIIKFIGYNPFNFDKSPNPVIITEFASTFSLEKMFELEIRHKKHPPFDDTKKLIIIYGIAAGMSFLHSNNIIHCDLKPKSIFLDEDLYPKISGFHLSKQISEETDQISSELVGTLAYLSPEILQKREYSKKSDVYAFSLVLYEILTNERPFNELNDTSILFEKVKSQQYRPKTDKNMNKTYQNLMEKCWSQDPQERPSFDEILNILKNDPNFITDQINKDEFFKYIEFIESSTFSFDATKKIHHLDHIVKTQLQFFDKHFNFSFHNHYCTCIDPIVMNGFSFDFTNFEKHEMIGKGSFGKVYKIVNKETGIIYAAKESLRYSDEISGDIMTNIKNEVEALNTLKFPSILKYIGFNFCNIKNKPKPTLILEYAPNGSLYDILEMERRGEKVKEWNETKKLITLYGVAAALNYMHSKRMIYVDMKPANILFDEYFYPKIADFGFSSKRFMKKSADNSDETIQDIPSNPEYIAPEVLRMGYWSESSDVYSFGIIAYEIITGEKPYKELTNPADIVNEVLNEGRPKFHKKINDGLYNLIQACWDSNPIYRPSFDEMIEKFDIFLIDSEGIDIDEFSNYQNYIESFNPDDKSGILTFKKNNTSEQMFEKVNIYLNRPKLVEKTNLSINAKTIELDKYDIISQVGEGCFGTVYKVINKETGESYAAKVSIYNIDQCDEDIITNFEREVNIISKLNHPSIMKFIGFNSLNFKYKRKPTIITEFVSSGSLDKIIELERMSIGIPDWDDTKKLINIFGIASELAYLHSLNILHRDLKPANILLDDYLFPKISDFGLSKQIFENQTQNNSGFKGTFAYTAPEVFEGKYSKAGDVFSFALIVYEIITNEILYPKCHQYQVMTQIRSGYRPPFNFNIPLCYKKLIIDCWNNNPNQRPTFDEIVYLLKNNPEFLTENVDKEEFYNYVSLVEEQVESKVFHSVSFDINKIQNSKKDDFSNENFLDLNKYEKGSLISKGDFYKLYKVKNKETGEICQGKISLIKLNDFTKDELINLSHEVNIISKLNHPSFMKFIGYSPVDFKNQRKPVILTEYSINDSLKKVLELERNNEIIKGWDDTKKLINIYGIASAMAYLHSNNIIHRDLQPCNIFLDDYLFPKIGDFGLSKRIHNLDTITYQTTSGLKGSPTYSSPEILQYSDYSKSGDVYAFSLVVYEILTHEIPFKIFINTNEIYNEVVIKGNRPEIPESIPICYRSIIEKCWNQDPKERPSFDEIVDQLKSNLNFITNKIRKEEFYDYIKFIGKSQLTFNFSNKILQIDDFIKSKNNISEDHHKINEEEAFDNETTNMKIVEENEKINEYEDDGETTDEKETNTLEENDEINENEKIDENKFFSLSETSVENIEIRIESIGKQENDLNYYLSLNNPQKLMEYLHEHCDNDLISSIFDRYYNESLEFYFNLCKEGLKLNNSVSHHKYAIFLIFNKDQHQLQKQTNIKFNEARSHLEESIRQGYIKSYFLLGRILHEYFHEDDEAFKFAQEGSNKNDNYSSCLLGYFLFKGIGVAQNQQKGIDLMLNSGVKDYYEQFSTDIGLYYINLSKKNQSKEEIAQYKEKAFDFFEKAYKINKTKTTINNLGICYMKGIGVSEDLEKAKEIFTLGVSKGDSNSKYHLDYILKQLNKE